MRSHLKRWIRSFMEHPKQGLDALNEYLENGGDVNKVYRGTTFLCEASRSGNLQAVEVIIEGGGDVNLRDGKGCTPLYLAACHGHPEVLRILLSAGADPDIPAQTNYTPLASSIQNNHDQCANILIDSGACVNVLRPNTLGVDISLLSYVLFAKGNIHMADKLLKAGTLPHQFMAPLGFILLDDPSTSVEFIRGLVSAGFHVYHESWIEIVKRKGEDISDKQRQVLKLLEHERKNTPSLQRLCRVNIRSALVKTRRKGHIKNMIDKLPLPVEVKKYVAMEYL